ncbi:MAG: hypothetical protein RSD13_02915 [Clostridium sp.]
MGKRKGEKEQEFTFHDLLRKMIDHHGVVNSKFITIEEFSELTKEITKDLRGNFRKEFFMEELADVFICLEMLMLVYEVDKEEFDEYVVDKMFRNMTRIKNDVALGEVMKNVVEKGGGTLL